MQAVTFFISTKWMISSCGLHSLSCSLFICVDVKTISIHSVLTELFFFFNIILSYSYLTLPEKQSSSAVTWASPGCHVFLKGCLRGTLQMEPLLISHSMMHFFILFIFLIRFSRSPRSSQWNVISILFPVLPCRHLWACLFLFLFFFVFCHFSLEVIVLSLMVVV